MPQDPLSPRARVLRPVAATVILTLGLAPIVAGQAFGFQATTSGGGSSGGGGSAPLNLLSPSFIAPAPRAIPRGGHHGSPATPSTGETRALAAPAVMTAPLPLPRPASAPQMAVAAAPQPEAPAQPETQPLLRPSMEEWPYEEDRSRVIIPGTARPAPSSAVEAIAAAAPQQAGSAMPSQAVAFAAPVPQVRPGNVTIISAAAPVTASMTGGPVLASASSTPVVLSSHGTVTTTIMPTAPAAGLAGAREAAIAPVPPARGPMLASLPPDSGGRDWPRFVPGARGEERNTGIAGERVIPDPGVPLTCLPAPVRRALNDVAMRFGPILVRSTNRGNGRFVRTDAWRGSYHKDCRAADFRVSGNPSAILAFLRMRPDLGGVKRYRNGLFHIDNGPRRSW